MTIETYEGNLINYDNIAHIYAHSSNWGKWTVSARDRSGIAERIAYYDTEEKAKTAVQEIKRAIIIGPKIINFNLASLSK